MDTGDKMKEVMFSDYARYITCYIEKH